MVAALLVLAAFGAAGGCQKALFPRDAPRHQFQAHDAMRGRDVPLTEPDAFGNPKPALRARLTRTR